MTDPTRTTADRLAELEDRLLTATGQDFTTTRQMLQTRRHIVFAGAWCRLARHENEGEQLKALRKAQVYLKQALAAIDEAGRA
jgi:hypothetical protein